MVKRVRDAWLDIYKPDNSSDTPDLTIPNDDINDASITRRIQNKKDKAGIQIFNGTGRYSGDITPGDRIEFHAQPEDGLRAYGTGKYGTGAYSETTRVWTGLVSNLTYQRQHPTKTTIDLQCEDFVFGVMAMRIVYNVFEDTQISGSSSAVLETLLSNKAPEIKTGLIGTISENTDVFINGKNLLDAVMDLARDGDAVLASKDQSIVFTPESDINSKFDLKKSDTFTESVRVNTDNIANNVRIDGGKGHDVDTSQTNHSNTITVTSTNNVTHQIKTRKSEIDRINLYTKADRTAGDSIIIRLQKDAGGAPIAPNDESSDIVKKQLSSEFLATDGWTKFIMPKHTLPEPQPWMILESDGSTGQDIGADANGNPAFKAHYPYPVSIRLEDRESQEEYRERETRIKDESLATFTAAKRVAEAKLQHDSEPERELNFEAKSDRAHNLDPGEAINANFPDITATGDYIVSQIKYDYSGSELRTDITSVEAGTL